MDGDIWGTLGMVARPWSSSSLSCGERLLLRCHRNAGNSSPTTQGKDPSSRARRRKRGSSGCERDSRASSRVETGMSWIFLSCSKGVKDLWKFQMLGVISLETPLRKRASSRLEGRTSWIFSIGAGVSTYDGDIRDPLLWPQERPVPIRVARRPHRIPLPSMPGPKTLCGVGAGT